MQDILGTSLPVYIAFVFIIFGGAAVLAGQGIATRWRPLGNAIGYGVIIALGARFMMWALYQAELLTASFFLDLIVIEAITLAAFRIETARMMAKQYPWLVERTGLFTWRARDEQAPASEH